jgi:ribosomal protein L16 Arg81 hydroxylase
MADIQAPDYERFPKLREALAAAQVAEMEPGDALFYPAMWWHQVEALESFNVMINYWWNTTPAYMDSPHNTLLHALLSLRDRPEQEKRAWRAMFDYYVFGPAGKAAAHLPEGARGNLAPLDEDMARRLRAKLLQRLNR